MKRLFLILIVVFSTLCQASDQVILVVGDSLSAAYGIRRDAGWVSLLQQRLRRQGYPHRVINASISGDTTAGGLARLPAALAQFKPNIILIELGANDGLRGLDFHQTRSNLAQMIRLSRAAGCRVLLLGMMLPPNFGKAYTERFMQLYKELAESEGVPLIPFFLEGVADRAEWMQPDGLHPNALGQPRMLANVWPLLQPLL